MVSREVVVRNATGLHARPASNFVLEAKKFDSDVSVRNTRGSHKPVNAKSIVMVLSANIPSRATIEITCDGPDEDEALDAMVRLVEGGMGV